MSLLKMKPIHQLFIAAVLLLCAFQVSAQTPIDVTFTPTTSTVALNAKVNIQMKVVNFKNIETIQFPIAYDKNVLQLDSIWGPHTQLKGFKINTNPDSATNVGLFPGRIAISWNSGSEQPNGATIPSNGVFINMRFKIVTACSSTINLVPMVQPIIDVNNASGQQVTVNYQNGAATITAGPCSGNPPVVDAPIQGFHIVANSIYIPAGEIGCMPVTGNDFDNISSMTYAINWDPSVLEMVGSRNSRINRLVPSDIQFGIFNNTGRLSLLWETAGAPNTRADLSPLYEVCFKAKGNAGASSMVTPNGMGFPPTGGAEVSQIVNNITTDIWKDTTGIKDTVFIQNTPTPSNAVAYIVENDSTVQNQVGCVDVRVKNFTNSSYGEFALTYDSLQLQFDHFSLGANPLGLDTSTTSVTNIENFLKFRRVEIVNQDGEEQTLRYIQYAYRKSSGQTLPDNSVVFSACFKAIGAVNTSIPVKIGSYLDPGNVLVPIGASKKTVGAIPIVFTSGSVFIKSASALSANMTVQNATCATSNNGAITLSVINCAGNATYNWSGPGITPANKSVQSPTALTPGAYVVTVTCTSGGTTTASATVTAPTAISVPTPTITNVTCFNGADGAFTVAPTGGSGTYTYSWTGPTNFTSNQPNLSGLKSGTYKVTVTDGSTCTSTAEYTVTSPAAIGLLTTGSTVTNIKCKGSTDGAINLPSPTGGTTPYTYSWTGPNGFTASTQSIPNLKAGSYIVVVTDSKGCSYTHTALTVSEPAFALAVTPPTVTNVKCFNTADGGLQISVSGGTTPYNYSWKNTSSGTVVSTLEDPNALAAGSYAVTVTDAAQCTSTSTAITINGPASALTVTPTHTDAACDNSGTGTIDLNIIGGWDASYNVAWPSPLTPTTHQANVFPGTYVATVTDQGGCVVNTSVTVGSANAIVIDTAVTNLTCHGQANGGIVITPSGGGTGTIYNVSWTGGLSGTSISGLSGGQYTPTVTNQASGCSKVFPAITVHEPAAIQVDSVVTAPSGGATNGSIVLTISGGTPAYTINWSGPNGFTAHTDSIGGLAAGNYLLTVTDANLCIFTNPINVNNPDPLFGTSVTSIKDACSNDGCIKLQIAPTATAAPFTISWAGGAPVTTAQNAVDVCGLAPGVYNLTITDANGSSTVLPAQTIAQLAAATAGSSYVEPLDDHADGAITLSPVPVGAPLSYLWNTGSTANPLNNLVAGTYTVTVTNDLSGCTSTYTFPLNPRYLPASGVFGTITQPGCANSATGAIAFAFSGANGPNYQYSWSGPNGFAANSANISNLYAGTYTLLITDESSNTFTYDTTIVDQSQLEITNVNETSIYTGNYQVSTASACDGKATVVFSGQAGIANIIWSNGITAASNTTLCAGAYSVTVVDQIGCSSVWSDSLTAPDGIAPVLQIIDPVSCAGKCDGIAQVTVRGGVGPYVVRWAFPGGQFQTDQLANSSAFSIADDLCSGNYSVTVTDGNGSTQLITGTIAEPAAITASFSQTLPTRFNACDAELRITAQGATGVVNYAWSGNNNSHHGNDARATGLCAGEVVTFSMVDERGCSAIASDSIGYPEGGCLSGSPVITPGERDGINDELYITCAETVDNTVEIFNRWGQLVFNVTNYDNNSVVWTGTTVNGGTLPEGVYFYVMTYTDDQGNQQRIKGYVNLLR